MERRKTYDEELAGAAERRREHTRSGQDIGPPPAVVNPPRRAAAFDSLQTFLETYFPARFSLAWSPDHLKVLARMEEAICKGGLFAIAMPRGQGKTSICIGSALWAGLTGRHLYVFLIGATAKKGEKLLKGAKTELAGNRLLAEDFPEVCHPVCALRNRANRAKGQHIDGAPTHIEWGSQQIVLPIVAGSVASAVVIGAAGLTSGEILGSHFVRPDDGRIIRPTLVIPDDPQTPKTAKSLVECENRHEIITGSILGLPGPGESITVVCPCTIIHKGDLADRLLDRKESPQWTGQTYRLVEKWPDRLDLWAEYESNRKDEMRNGGDGALATAWYAERRAEMDRGAVVSWDQRVRVGEISALQNAFNVRMEMGERSFSAQCQNDPMPDEQLAGQLLPAEVAARVNGLDRGAVPLAASHLVAYVDVQQKALYYLVSAWSDSFGGSVLDYGTYPDQQKRYFTLADVQRTLARAAPGAGLEGSIHAGLTRLAEQLLGREWQREDGTAQRIERLVVDANWGASTDVVYSWCRSTPHAALTLPAHGRYVGAASKPWSEYEKRPGEKLGLHWMLTAGTGKRGVRHLLIDTNWWKTFVAERLQMAVGDKGALALWGKPGTDHRMLAEQLCSEYRIRTEGRGRTVDEWKLRPERPDNHLWDCLVGCAAAASLQGCTISEAQAPHKPREKVSYKQMQAEAQKRRAAG